jgi:hypothetical protein
MPWYAYVAVPVLIVLVVWMIRARPDLWDR